jgi:arsenate reductase (thioredoxin)
MTMVAFVCPHGSAKSVIAAAYLQHLAEQQGFPIQALCGGTEPDEAIAPAVLAWLRANGLPIPQRLPQSVTQQDLTAASRVVAMNCELDGVTPAGVALECWEDVPPVSQDLHTASAIILTHVERLLYELRLNP